MHRLVFSSIQELRIIVVLLGGLGGYSLIVVDSGTQGYALRTLVFIGITRELNPNPQSGGQEERVIYFYIER